MLKILFTVAILAAIYFIFFKKPKNKNGADANELEDMTECSKCGMFISENEAFEKDGKLFCSKECLN